MSDLSVTGIEAIIDGKILDQAEKTANIFREFKAHMWERHGDLERVLHTGMDAIKKECVEECLGVAEAGGMLMRKIEADLTEKFEYLEENLNRALAKVEEKIQMYIDG